MPSAARDVLVQLQPLLSTFDQVGSDVNTLAANLDHRSNESDRRLRALIAEHITTSNHDLVAAMGLMAVSARAERMVDLAREMVELSAEVRAPLPGRYVGPISALVGEHIAAIAESIDAIATSDGNAIWPCLSAACVSASAFKNISAPSSMITTSACGKASSSIDCSISAPACAHSRITLTPSWCSRSDEIDFVSEESIARARLNCKQPRDQAFLS